MLIFINVHLFIINNKKISKFPHQTSKIDPGFGVFQNDFATNWRKYVRVFWGLP
jgi:hypothetical protein